MSVGGRGVGVGAFKGVTAVGGAGVAVVRRVLGQAASNKLKLRSKMAIRFMVRNLFIESTLWEQAAESRIIRKL